MSYLADLILTCACKYNISFDFSTFTAVSKIIIVAANWQTFDVDHRLCFTAVCLETVFPRVLFLAPDYD